MVERTKERQFNFRVLVNMASKNKDLRGIYSCTILNRNGNGVVDVVPARKLDEREFLEKICAGHSDLAVEFETPSYDSPVGLWLYPSTIEKRNQLSKSAKLIVYNESQIPINSGAIFY